MSDDETLLDDTRTVKTMQTIKDMVIPKGEVTIIYTDVQGSTALWEADPMSMKKATDIHDSIIRRCYSDYKGYEITTEGDAFNIAFQHPSDAIAFALKAQLALYRAKWPEGTLNHPDGCDNEKKKFRGFRVRFGMHHGPTTSTVHKTTGRTTYQGEAVEIAKAIEKMSHGGQILTTVETWRTVSGMAEQLLGSPQVMDCGEHLLWDPKKSDIAKKKASSKKVLSKRIVQLVPNSLSYDFFAARGGQEVKEGETPQKVCGRVFPPLLSHGQLSTSFLNAPYIGNKVAMVFVYTDKMEAITDRERKKNYKILAKYVRSHLMRLSPPGYECQEDKGSWMLAFDRIDNGINFGLDLKENVMKNAKLLGDVDKSQVFRVGIHWGPFLSMGPHTVTGHADYFGPIVNRAARVAAQCEPGQVCVGVPMGTDEEPPDPGPTVEVDVLGVKQLKGISIEMAIFGCRKKEKETKGEGGDETAT
jgi:class 3 adenylate cyclase